MLADIGNNVITNTNEIRNIRVVHIDNRQAERPWAVMVYMQNEIYEAFSFHETKADAIAQLELLRCELKKANCLIDLRSIRNNP